MPLHPLFQKIIDSVVPTNPLPYCDWDQARLDDYVGFPITPLPDALRVYIDGQEEFSELEHDAIETVVERYFNIPAGYGAAFCSFAPVPREVVLVRWAGDEESRARKSLV